MDMMQQLAKRGVFLIPLPAEMMMILWAGLRRRRAEGSPVICLPAALCRAVHIQLEVRRAVNLQSEVQRAVNLQLEEQSPVALRSVVQPKAALPLEASPRAALPTEVLQSGGWPRAVFLPEVLSRTGLPPEVRPWVALQKLELFRRLVMTPLAAIRVSMRPSL